MHETWLRPIRGFTIKNLQWNQASKEYGVRASHAANKLLWELMWSYWRLTTFGSHVCVSTNASLSLFSCRMTIWLLAGESPWLQSYFRRCSSLVTAVQRGSGPAVLSLILLELWSGGSHRRQTVPPNREVLQRSRSGDFPRHKTHGTKKKYIYSTTALVCLVNCLISCWSPTSPLVDFWRRKSDFY